MKPEHKRGRMHILILSLFLIGSLLFSVANVLALWWELKK